MSAADLLAALRDPTSPAFQGALQHVVSSIVGHSAAPELEAQHAALRAGLLPLPAEQLADMATLAVLLAIKALEADCAHPRARTAKRSIGRKIYVAAECPDCGATGGGESGKPLRWTPRKTEMAAPAAP